MTRLADEYFKRDLSEAEEQQLSEELASSSEDAQTMAEHMGELYAQTGLPEPVWQDKPLPSSLLPGKLGILKKLLSLSLVLTLAGVLGYWGYHRFCPSGADSIVPVKPPESLLQQPASPSGALQNSSDKASNSTRPAPQDSSAAQNRVATVASPAKAAKPAVPFHSGSIGTYQPGLPTVPSSPGRLYQELAVVVDLPESALATVRVYDHLNNEIRMLYAGILRQGKRTFVWDGKDEAGLVAPPGVYTIEVKSGEKVMRQEVHVQADQGR